MFSDGRELGAICSSEEDVAYQTTTTHVKQNKCHNTNLFVALQLILYELLFIWKEIFQKKKKILFDVQKTCEGAPWTNPVTYSPIPTMRQFGLGWERFAVIVDTFD
jgi:hypothetical protein